MYSHRSRVFITDHNGETRKAYCLPLGQRSKFLEHWEDAWQIIKESDLAQFASQHGKTDAIAYLWDQGEVGNSPAAERFKWLVEQMLNLHGLDAKWLDITQIAELLFFSGNGNGLLVNLQFPSLPPGIAGKAETGNPYYKLLAMISMRSGDWMGSIQALELLPYDELLEILAEQERLYSEARSDSPPLESTELPSDFDTIRENALAKFYDEQKQAGMQAIIEKMRQDT